MRFGSNRRADRTNRTVLATLGLVLVVAATSGLVVSFLESTKDRPPIDVSARTWLIDHGTLIGLVALAAVAVAVLASLAWLRRQFAPVTQLDDLVLDHGEHGRTIVSTDALTTVIADEMIELRGVAAASAHVRANDPDTIEVLVDLDERASVARIADEASGQVLSRARRAVGRPDLRLALEVRPIPVAAPPRVA